MHGFALEKFHEGAFRVFLRGRQNEVLKRSSNKSPGEFPNGTSGEFSIANSRWCRGNYLSIQISRWIWDFWQNTLTEFSTETPKGKIFRRNPCRNRGTAPKIFGKNSQRNFLSETHGTSSKRTSGETYRENSSKTPGRFPRWNSWRNSQKELQEKYPGRTSRIIPAS